jgi:hypothetical protein
MCGYLLNHLLNCHSFLLFSLLSKNKSRPIKLPVCLSVWLSLITFELLGRSSWYLAGRWCNSRGQFSLRSDSIFRNSIPLVRVLICGACNGHVVQNGSYEVSVLLLCTRIQDQFQRTQILICISVFRNEMCLSHLHCTQFWKWEYV